MKEYLTKEKFEELKTELDFLTKTKRKDIAKQLDDTASMGDLKENAEYHQAREAQAELEQRIMKLESILSNVEIIDYSKNKEGVNIGNIVVVNKKGQKDNIEYKVVGPEESNMAEGKISLNSPLVQAMLGKKKGDTFSFNAPSGILMEYKIVDIK